MTQIGLKEFRENVNDVIKKIKLGDEVIIMRKSEPLFKVSSLDNEKWEEVVDFTKIQTGGVDIDELLMRL
jgi:antitoxin (DNA-binding transcriptional repressor) of toxin-antitoxin stability system